MPNAELLTIGDELLSGETADTNSHWLDGALEKIGWTVTRHVTVPDDRPVIAHAFREAATRAEVVISSGGLGPTQDDVTMAALAEALCVPLHKDERVLDSIKARFAQIGRTMTPNNEQQAMVPEHGEVLDNAKGTAPGFSGMIGATRIFVLPGVPREMRWMFGQHVAPRIGLEHPAMLRRTIKVVGLGESKLEHTIREIVAAEPEVRFGYRTLFVENHVKLAAPLEAREALERAEKAIRDALGDRVYGADDELLEELVGRMLVKRKETVALAESCTGGLAGKRLTDVAGSSSYFVGGVVAYSNEVKAKVLGVDRALLEKHGAVSLEVALEMARCVRAKLSATWGLSATGVAGPGGGTEDKPVGRVYIGLSGPSEEHVEQLQLFGDREQIRGQTVTLLLDLLRRRTARR